MSSKLITSVFIVILLTGCSRQEPKASTASASPVNPAHASPQPTAPPAAEKELTIPAGTRIYVRLAQTLDTKTSHAGESFTAHLDRPVIDGERVVIPKGVAFSGHVVEAKSSGRLKGRAHLELTLDSFTLRGERYRIATNVNGEASGGHKRRNATLIGGGAGAGAAIGAIAGGGAGAGIGAGAGAAVGVTTAFFTGKKNVRLPAETPVVFSLRNSVNIRG